MAKLLKSLNTNKTTGPVGIPPNVLKKLAAELCNSFKPIPIKGNKTVPNNYRPMALVATITKDMKKVVNLKYLESANTISYHRYGLHKHKSTRDLLVYVTNVWQL
ncbi:uncharacterized protein LOC130447901 [Diorhabda sublineata]|uniref:uncharacterized protein LOC130447901 n=1 Tax=Diorhabda sublineata TaxID=1163346 RepID=UPI0024E0F725|nr:uncharacterized protein LOC130447901 [Diorhabda sublineata]